MNQIKVLLAPNSMKGSMSAFEFADTVEKAFKKVSDHYVIRKIPVADGGDCTGEVLQKAFDAQVIEVEVRNPFGRNVISKYAVAGDMAFIEMADASGVKLVGNQKLNPMIASSYGTGQLIAAAIEKGCKEIMLGIGGSATVDGGTGLIEALGFKMFDKEGRQLDGNGENLEKIASVSYPELPAGVQIKIITDVDNHLLGSRGAAAVFGPQKGATSAEVEKLERGLNNWCTLLETTSGKRLSEREGSGAAGGLSLPLLAWFEADIVPGAAFILDLLDFEKHVNWADIVITGEGKIDSQTMNNKAPKAVADVANMAGKPVIAIGGTVEADACDAFCGAFSFLSGPVTLSTAMKDAGVMLSAFSIQLAKFILSVYKSH